MQNLIKLCTILLTSRTLIISAKKQWYKVQKIKGVLGE